MGQILKTKTTPSGKVILYLELTIKEAQTLKSHTKKVRVFSENLCTHNAKIISKGVNHEAKSVAIPLSLRSRFNPRLTEIAYQKIETDRKIFYIATAKKDLLTN